MIYPAKLSMCLLLAVTANAADFKNLEDAAYEPGNLKLPLTVVERSGVDRHGVVVSGGVPFPAGLLSDVNRLCVVDDAGQPVACQATVMTRWRRRMEKRGDVVCRIAE